MELTKNEKRILKMLVHNARASDSEIAEQMGISSQAVGKIRRKLETTVIESYTANLNLVKLGIKTFVLAKAKLTKEGMDKGELDVEQRLMKNPNVITVYRIPQLSSTHIILYGFKDLSEMDDYFHSQTMKNELHSFIESQELFTFSHNSLLKNSPAQLLQKAIDELSSLKLEPVFKELERFKMRAWDSKLMTATTIRKQ
jgi:DNA-binding Lrp family transcriptional regulator